MDRVQLVLLGLPILLFCSDLVTLFAPQPPTAPRSDRRHPPDSDALQTGDPSADAAASTQVAEPQVDGPGFGTTVELKFCASCSYREVVLVQQGEEEEGQEGEEGQEMTTMRQLVLLQEGEGKRFRKGKERRNYWETC